MSNNGAIRLTYHRTQPSTFAIHPSQHATENCKRACLFASSDFTYTKKNKSFKDRENEMIELKIYLKPLTGRKTAQLVINRTLSGRRCLSRYNGNPAMFRQLAD